MDRMLLVIGAAAGFLGVALGAFGAHGLRDRLAPLPDGAQRMQWWQTGAQYHLVHALGILVAAMIAGRSPSVAASVAAWCFAAGIGLFSGSLYVMTLTGKRALGAVTPLGGLAFLAGWVGIGASALAG
jgi:uncharacterized membrane protein YgdD (TMEM256/DUF423 family)